MSKIIFDTNAILRFILNDIPSQHRKVVDIVKRAKLKQLEIIIPEIVVFETIFTLKSYYEYDRLTILNVLESLLTSDYLLIESRLVFIETLKLYKEFNISFVDAFLMAKSKILGVKLFTFDEKLNKKSNVIASLK